MSELNCPMCGGKSLDEVFTASNGFPIVRCRDCRLAFSDDRNSPPPDQLYPAFDQSKSVALDSLRSALAVFLRQREGVVTKFKQSGRLLDYGCGNGAFAKWMSKHGFEAVGLEPFSLGDPHEEPNLKLVRAPLAQASKDLGTFDVITMWHVLEHVPDPVEVLTKLRALLNPGGVLIVSVPNFSSWQSTVFKGSWFHLDPPRHLLQFEPDTLTDCLGRAGLSPVGEVRFLPEYGSSGWIQSALNRVLPHSNFLYELVKDRGALKEMSPLSQALHLAGSMALGAPVFALSMPVEAAAALSNKGAALTVAAVAR